MLLPWPGLATTDHVAPSHDSTRVPSLSPPTATQVTELAQETPRSALSPVLRLGLDVMVQVLPFRDSTRVFSAPVPRDRPTATQVVAPVQDTPVR